VERVASSPRHPVETSLAAAELSARDDQLCAWMEQYGPGLRRFLLKRVSAAEADDLVQEVFIALRARRAASEIENVEGYLFKTAVSVLARQRRRRTWRWGEQEPIELAEALSDEVSPERIAIGRDGVRRVVSAMKALPSRSAEAFFLSRFEQLTNEEVARRMGISVKAVEELMRRAMHRLMAELGTER
jgi:RNA polymerase sigma-70 factor (ECF subfamily)